MCLFLGGFLAFCNRKKSVGWGRGRGIFRLRVRIQRLKWAVSLDQEGGRYSSRRPALGVSKEMRCGESWPASGQLHHEPLAGAQTYPTVVITQEPVLVALPQFQALVGNSNSDPCKLTGWQCQQGRDVLHIYKTTQQKKWAILLQFIQGQLFAS